MLGTNRIDRFQRLPSDLRKYLEYTTQIKARYGSVMRFVVKERLRWGDGDDLDALKPKGRPFEHDGPFCPPPHMSYDVVLTGIEQRTSRHCIMTGRTEWKRGSSIWLYG